MLPLHQYLFIDIETVSSEPDFASLSPAMQDLWMKKALTIRLLPLMDPDPALLYEQRAAIYSEFAKVVCISLGCLVKKEDGYKIYLKSLTATDEKDLLLQFNTAIKLFFEREKDLIFCGHNIKEFDIPFLCRRMVIHDIALPDSINLGSKKPWEVNHVDTMDLWRFGDKKNFTSLALLAAVLGIPTPKDDMDGSMVGEVYWKQQGIARIAGYCMKDVITAALVFLRLKNLRDIHPEPVYL